MAGLTGNERVEDEAAAVAVTLRPLQLLPRSTNTTSPSVSRAGAHARDVAFLSSSPARARVARGGDWGGWWPNQTLWRGQPHTREWRGQLWMSRTTGGVRRPGN
jgi:hypothetical protein